MRQKLALILRWEADASLIYGILSAFRGFAVGPVTGLMVVSFLSVRDQGCYYCFRSLLGASLAAELGIQSMLPPLVAHEWVHLEQDENGVPRGEPQTMARWIGLCRASLLYYLAGSPVLCSVLFACGTYTVMRSNPSDFSWQAPWVAVCCLGAPEFCLRPIALILEGCQKVTAVFRVRLWQGLLASFASWGVLASGGGLWCLAASMTVTAAVVAWPMWEFRSLLRPLWRRPSLPGVSWRKEVWPMQWRIGLASLAYSLATGAVIPLIFSLLGAGVAGQYGLSSAISQLVCTIVVIWAQTRAAEIAKLVATRQTGRLHLLLYRVIAYSLLSGVISSAAAILAQSLLHHFGFKLYFRMLSEGPTAILLASAVAYHCTAPLAIYLRAHRYEPYLYSTLIYAVILLCATYFLTRLYGINGAVSAQLLAALLVLPLNVGIWWAFRQRTYRTPTA